MTLNQFNGGLNTNITPNLITVNEAQICENVNFDSLSVKPLNGLTALEQTIPIGEEGFTRFNGQWISNNGSTSYVEFNDNLYFSDSINTIQKTSDGLTISDIGLDAPSTTPSVSASGIPTLVIANNTDTTATSTIATNTMLLYMVVITTTDGKPIYIKDGFFYTGNYGVSIALSNYTGVESFSVYKFSVTSVGYRLVGSSINSAVIDLAPKGSTDRSQSYDSTEYIATRNYVYTYYSSITKFESAPSPASDDVKIMEDNVVISNLVGSGDLTVDTIKIYRIGGDLTNYYHVASIPSTQTSYTDTKTDLEVLDGDGLLETQGLIRPPEGLKFLTEFNLALFASIDSTLYFSNPGLVDQWTDFNYIEFPEHITALGSTQNGLLVFSRNKTWMIVGESLATYSKVLLHNSQGCISHSTVSYVENNLVWLSLDGICVSNGGSIQLISEQKLGKLNLEPITSEVYEGKYYLFHDTGCLITDFRYGTIKFTNLDLIVRGAYYDYFFDKLYILLPSDIGMREYGTGSPLSMTYKTGWLATNGITNYKTYKDIYIHILGSLTLKLYIDGTLTNTVTLTNGVNNVRVAQGSHKGYYIEFEFTGIGELKEINFETEGRQNGR